MSLKNPVNSVTGFVNAVEQLWWNLNLWQYRFYHEIRNTQNSQSTGLGCCVSVRGKLILCYAKCII